MTDHELTVLLRDANPVDDATVHELPLTQSETHLRRAIPARRPPVGSHLMRGWSARPLMHRAAIAGVAGAAVLAVGGAIGLNVMSGDGARPAWSAELVQMAESSPRMLFTQPGWKVTRADEFTRTAGEMEFARGDHRMQLNWYPAKERPIEQPGPNSGTTLVDRPDRDGHPVTVVNYDGSPRYRASWQQDGRTLEVDGTADSAASFLESLGTLTTVDVDAWLSAMPDSVITQASKATRVDEMLTGVPLPPGFDVDALRNAPGVRDDYQLGAQVSGAVACGWLDRWAQATARGDAATAANAVKAMRTSRSWSVLVAMQKQGDYPAALWELADGMTTTVYRPKDPPGEWVRTTYVGALGCSYLPS